MIRSGRNDKLSRVTRKASPGVSYEGFGPYPLRVLGRGPPGWGLGPSEALSVESPPRGTMARKPQDGPGREDESLDVTGTRPSTRRTVLLVRDPSTRTGDPRAPIFVSSPHQPRRESTEVNLITGDGGRRWSHTEPPLSTVVPPPYWSDPVTVGTSRLSTTYWKPYRTPEGSGGVDNLFFTRPGLCSTVGADPSWVSVHAESRHVTTTFKRHVTTPPTFYQAGETF